MLLLLSSSAVLQVRVIRSLAVSVVVIVAIVVSCITGTCYQIVSCQCGFYCCSRRQLYHRYVLSDCKLSVWLLLLLSLSAVLQVRVIRSLAVSVVVIVAIVVSCITGTCCQTLAVSVVVIVAIVVSCIIGTCYQIVSCQCGCYCCYRCQLYYMYVLSNR